MARVPRNGNTQLERLRSGRQKAIIVGGVPIPAGEDPLLDFRSEGESLLRAEIRDEVSGQPELMSTLERSRFRDFLFNEIALPHGQAVRLEDLEEGLRLAGLVGPDEIVVQRGSSGTKFRVAKRQVAVDGHLDTPSVCRGFPGRNALHHSAVVTGGEAPRGKPRRHSKSRF